MCACMYRSNIGAGNPRARGAGFAHACPGEDRPADAARRRTEPMSPAPNPSPGSAGHWPRHGARWRTHAHLLRVDGVAARARARILGRVCTDPLCCHRIGRAMLANNTSRRRPARFLEISATDMAKPSSNSVGVPNRATSDRRDGRTRLREAKPAAHRLGRRPKATTQRRSEPRRNPDIPAPQTAALMYATAAIWAWGSKLQSELCASGEAEVGLLKPSLEATHPAARGRSA